MPGIPTQDVVAIQDFCLPFSPPKLLMNLGPSSSLSEKPMLPAMSATRRLEVDRVVVPIIFRIWAERDSLRVRERSVRVSVIVRIFRDTLFDGARRLVS